MGRPTKTAFALGASSLLIFLVGSNIQSGWLYVLGASIAGVVVSGLFIPVAVVRRLDVSRKVPPVGRVGDSVDVVLELVNQTGSTKSGITGRDTFISDTPFVIERLAPRSSAAVPYQLRLVRRGIYKQGAVSIESGFPFGVGRVKRQALVSSELIVHPSWTALHGFPLLEAASSPNEPIHDRRRKGSGLEFFGIREHRSGDSLRHVHWRSTARTGRLLVREYEEQPSSRLGVWIDSGPTVGEEPRTAFEDAVSSAASLVLYGLDVGHPAQLFCDTRRGLQHLFEPGRHDTLDWLAGLEAEGRRGLSRLAGDMIGEVHSRSTHVLLFPTTARCVEDVPGAIGILQGSSARVIAVAFSAASYARRKTSDVLSESEEEKFLAQIGSQRVIIYRVTRDRDIGECLRDPFLY
jgi:uncharacterized protein (DUF58 family)